MAIELQFNADDVGKMVQDAILKSALGNALTKAIDEAINNRSSFQPSVFQKAVNDAIADSVRRTVFENAEMRAAIDERVLKALHESLQSEALKTVIEKMVEKIRLSDY